MPQILPVLMVFVFVLVWIVYKLVFVNVWWLGKKKYDL